jgi:protein gp37
MSDLFHDDVPLDFIRQVFSVIHSTPWHIYQILTKRQSRLGDLASKLDFPENIWLGVSVENQNHIDRIEYLRTVPVSVRFISCEPLLGPLELNLTGIDWVIVGGESGQKHRQMKLDWARDIRDQCQNSGVAFFFKQVGGRTPKAGGRLLDDKIWDEMPNAWNQHIQTWGSVPLKLARRSEKLELIA